MKFDPGCVVLVSFPFSDLQNAKKRPVLLLTAPDSYGDFICLAITSREHHANSVVLNQDDMAEGVLPKLSWIRTDKVFTLSQGGIVKTVGRVKREIIEQSLEGLCSSVSYLG